MGEKLVLTGCIVAGGSIWALGKSHRYAFHLNAENTRIIHPLVLGTKDEIESSDKLDPKQAERKAATLNAAEDDRIREENALIPKWKYMVLSSVQVSCCAAFAVGVYYVVKGFTSE